MRSLILTALTAVLVAAASAEHQSAETWYSTFVLTPSATSWREIAYGPTAVTPVSSTTALVLLTSYFHEPLASRNINVTTFPTVTKTLPVTTVTSSVYTTRSSLPTISLDETTTETLYLVTTIATVTLATLVNPNGSPPRHTSTVYSGTYRPHPGQITASPASTAQTAWPTSVTTHLTLIDMYRIFTYTGTTSTVTSFWTETVYRTTATAATTSTMQVLPCVPIHGDTRRCTHTAYASTSTLTKADARLAFVNATRTVHAGVPTVTYAAKCAPSNLISAVSGRAGGEGYGVGVELSPDEFTFPMDFPGTLIGVPPRLVPGGGAAGCCQLCVDNDGCAASEYTAGGWEVACRLFYAVPDLNFSAGGGGRAGRESTGKDLCRRGRGVSVRYYGSVYALPGQGSLIQAGCGTLKYLGVMDPFCPSCKEDG